MDIPYLINLLQNKLNYLSNAQSAAVAIGDLNSVNSINQEILSTQNTLAQLKLLQQISITANATNTTTADIVQSGIDAVTGSSGNPNPDAIANMTGYDISTYATDPQYEQKIGNILHNMPPLSTGDGVGAYISTVVSGSPLTGEMIYGSATQYSVDLRLLTAILQLESQFGTTGVGASTFNPGNVGNTDSGATKTFSSWTDGVSAVAVWLNAHRVPTTTPTLTTSSSQTTTSSLDIPVLSRVVIVPTLLNITAGNATKLSVNTLDQNGSMINGVTTTFLSNDTSVATVDNTGLVTAVSAGTTSVSVQATLAENTATANTTIIVSTQIETPLLASIAVTPTTLNVLTGSTGQLQPVALDHNGNILSNATITFTSDNKSIATVDNTGLVTAVSAGTATITAEATLNGNTASANSVITISDPIVTPPPIVTTPVDGSSTTPSQ